MKAELRADTHRRLAGVTVFEVWWNGQFIATVTGADGPGVRVISKYPMHAAAPDALVGIHVTTVLLDLPREPPKETVLEIDADGKVHEV